METEAAPALLSLQQQARLDELERRIAAGLSAFLDVAEALWEIKAEGLFRAHGSFEAYCKQRWGFSAHHAARILRSFNVACLLEENGDRPLPENLPENLLRPLCPLEPPLQVSVWRLANQVSGGPPESAVISRLVRAVQHAIDRGVKGEKGTTSRDSRKPPHTSGDVDFFAALRGLTTYPIVRQLDEATARSHLAACQHMITMCHDAIEQIRVRFPWI